MRRTSDSNAVLLALYGYSNVDPEFGERGYTRRLTSEFGATAPGDALKFYVSWGDADNNIWAAVTFDDGSQCGTLSIGRTVFGVSETFESTEVCGLEVDSEPDDDNHTPQYTICVMLDANPSDMQLLRATLSSAAGSMASVEEDDPGSTAFHFHPWAGIGTGTISGEARFHSTEINHWINRGECADCYEPNVCSDCLNNLAPEVVFVMLRNLKGDLAGLNGTYALSPLCQSPPGKFLCRYDFGDHFPGEFYVPVKPAGVLWNDAIFSAGMEGIQRGGGFCGMDAGMSRDANNPDDIWLWVTIVKNASNSTGGGYHTLGWAALWKTQADAPDCLNIDRVPLSRVGCIAASTLSQCPTLLPLYEDSEAIMFTP
jgi:hypothetical protein